MTQARQFDNSRRHMTRARRVLPRGVSSAKRASRRPTPLVFVDGDGSHLRDADGNDYIDYVAGFGPLLLGHRPQVALACGGDQLYPLLEQRSADLAVGLRAAVHRTGAPAVVNRAGSAALAEVARRLEERV